MNRKVIVSTAILVSIFCLVSCSTGHYLPRKDLLTYDSTKILIIPSIFHNEKDQKKYYVKLINKKGETEKKWAIDFHPLSGRMDQDKNLYVSGNSGKKDSKIHNGISNLLVKYDFDGNILWKYNHEDKHHDFFLLPNKNILILQYYPLEAKSIGKKLKPSYYKNKLWFEEIIEINPETNEKVWSWKSHKHMSSKEIKHIGYSGDVLHANSLSYIDNFYMTNKPAVMFSSRSQDTVYIIDKESKKIIWKSPEGLFRNQHDANFTSEQSIMVFNNNESPMYSSVIEYDLKEKKVIWKYVGGTNTFEYVSFYSSVISGAQKLSNGNTLVTLGTRGYLVEVDRNKKVVWNYFNIENEFNLDVAYPFTSIFKARAYQFSN